MYERLTESFRRVMGRARHEAHNDWSKFIGTEHLLIGLLAQETDFASKYLRRRKVSVERVRREIKLILPRPMRPCNPLRLSPGQIELSPRAKNAISMTWKEDMFGSSAIGTEDLLLGLVHETNGVAYQILENLEIDPIKIIKALLRRLKLKKK